MIVNIIRTARVKVIKKDNRQFFLNTNIKNTTSISLPFFF